MLGGDKTLSREFTRLLVWHEQHTGMELREDDRFIFPVVDIALGKHHDLSTREIVINVRKCMKYITPEINAKVIMNDRMVKKFCKTKGSVVEKFSFEKGRKVSFIKPSYVISILLNRYPFSPLKRS